MRRHIVRFALGLLALAPAFFLAPAAPQGAQAQDATARFTVTDVMIPARDGVKLHTTIYAPKDQAGPLPILFKRTPYGIAGAPGTLAGAYKELVDEGFIFVFQDIRGKYGSGGTFVMQRPMRDSRAEGAIDESTDAYDTIDWLVKNVPDNNGRVGMLGVSYDGWLAAMAAADPHPALRAVSPQAPPADMWLGDDFHHNGAFRLSYGFEYAVRMESSKEQANFAFDRYDTFEWYLALGPLANINAKYLHGRIPSWNDFVSHPDYDAFWKRQTLVPFLTSVRVPTLTVAGWWDQEDFYGPLRVYDTLESHDVNGLNFLVVGPWNHGGWNAAEGRVYGGIDFGSATAKYFREKIQAPWFASYLKDVRLLMQPEAVTFEAGANEWRSWSRWPPRAQTQERNLYVQAGGALSFTPPPPAPAASFDQFSSDPAHPVPYRHRPIPPTYFPSAPSGWSTWLFEDQRFVDDRPDVLTWETAPLAEDVAIAGRIVAHLFASTTGSDSDWIVKLIDVYPEEYPADWRMAGYELMVANEVFRGRYRNSFEKPVALTPNAVVHYTIDLHAQNYRFKKGHRIMVQVQSTWFPLIDRNPQTFVPNIFDARAGDYRAATQRVYRSGARSTHITLPVVTAPR
jgi:putative CocE/NonD family hydrolase